MKVMIDTDEVWLPGNYDVLYATLDSITPYQAVVALSLSGETKQYFIKNHDYDFVSLWEEDQRKFNKTHLTDFIMRSGEKVRNIEFVPVEDYYRRAPGNLAEILDCMAKAVGQVEVIPSNTKQPITYEKLCQNGTVIQIDGAKFTCDRSHLMSCLDTDWVSEYGYSVGGAYMAKNISECSTLVVVERG